MPGILDRLSSVNMAAAWLQYIMRGAMHHVEKLENYKLGTLKLQLCYFKTRSLLKLSNSISLYIYFIMHEFPLSSTHMCDVLVPPTPPYVYRLSAKAHRFPFL